MTGRQRPVTLICLMVMACGEERIGLVEGSGGRLKYDPPAHANQYQ
jgi:hypothetical protein